jgi:ribosomal protein S27E
MIALCRYCSARWKGIQMPEGLTCPNCDSPSVVYPEATKDHAAVACGGCGTFLATRGQFRQLLERQAVQSRMVTTGC